MGLGYAKDRLKSKETSLDFQLSAAKELIETMGELKGGLMKVGQMVSITGDMVLPEEVTDLFKTLQSSTSYMPREELEKVFNKSFQQSPDDLFTKFDWTPIAAASIGQVHVAENEAGEKLAVKVQYPKIVDAISGDLENLDKIEKLFDVFNIPKPQMDVVLEEIKRSLIEECDYIREAKAMQDISSDLRGKFDGIKIPKVYPEFSSNEVLTTEFVSGDRFEETLNYKQKDKDFLGQLLYESYLHSLFVNRHLHTDPQNGNYLFNNDRIFLFDFGSTKYFSEEFVQNYAILQYAVEIRSVELYKKVGMELGIIQESDEYSFIESHLMMVDKIYRPFLKEGAYFAEVPNPIGLVKEFVTNMDFKGRPSPKEDFLLLDRANVGLFTKLQAWKSRVNWREAMLRYREPALKEGLKRFDWEYKPLEEASKS
ncbi:MAG: ABC1 kinase family protein [Bdellovibrionales bacterium]